MKLIYFLVCFFLFLINSNAQESKKEHKNKTIYIGGAPNILIYLNDTLIAETKLRKIHPNKIGAIFCEGDSTYLSITLGNNPDTSLIRQYFGKKRDAGILFVFTKDRVNTITKEQLIEYIQNDKSKIVFVIDNKTLSNDIAAINFDKISEIQMISTYTLTKWDTGNQDIFTLFIIKTNK